MELKRETLTSLHGTTNSERFQQQQQQKRNRSLSIYSLKRGRGGANLGKFFLSRFLPWVRQFGFYDYFDSVSLYVAWWINPIAGGRWCSLIIRVLVKGDASSCRKVVCTTYSHDVRVSIITHLATWWVLHCLLVDKKKVKNWFVVELTDFVVERDLFSWFLLLRHRGRMCETMGPPKKNDFQ